MQIDERKADLESREAELRAVEQEVAGLRQRVSSQAVSREDVARMIKERRRLDEALQAAGQQREAAERACASAEHELNGMWCICEPTYPRLPPLLLAACCFLPCCWLPAHASHSCCCCC